MQHADSVFDYRAQISLEMDGHHCFASQPRVSKYLLVFIWGELQPTSFLAFTCNVENLPDLASCTVTCNEMSRSDVVAPARVSFLYCGDHSMECLRIVNNRLVQDDGEHACLFAGDEGGSLPDLRVRIHSEPLVDKVLKIRLRDVVNHLTLAVRRSLQWNCGCKKISLLASRPGQRSPCVHMAAHQFAHRSG